MLAVAYPAELLKIHLIDRWRGNVAENTSFVSELQPGILINQVYGKSGRRINKGLV